MGLFLVSPGSTGLDKIHEQSMQLIDDYTLGKNIAECFVYHNRRVLMFYADFINEMLYSFSLSPFLAP